MVKAGWPKEKVAIYELLFFAAHLLSFAWSTGVNNALLAYYPTLNEERKKILLFNAGLLLMILSILDFPRVNSSSAYRPSRASLY